MFHKSKQNLEALYSEKEAEFHNYSRVSVVFQDSLETENNYEQASNNEVNDSETLSDGISGKKHATDQNDVLRKIFKKSDSRKENNADVLKANNILQPINDFQYNSVKNIPHNNVVNEGLKNGTKFIKKMTENVVISDFSINKNKLSPNKTFEQKTINNETEKIMASKADLYSCNNSRNFYYYEDEKDEKEEMLKIMAKKEEQLNEAEMFAIPKLHLVDSDEETERNEIVNTSEPNSPQHMSETHPHNHQILPEKISSGEKVENTVATTGISNGVEQYHQENNSKRGVDDRMVENGVIEKKSSKRVQKHASTPNLQNINIETNKHKVTPLYKYYRKIPNRTYTEIHKNQIKNSRKKSCQNDGSGNANTDSNQKQEDQTDFSRNELFHEQTSENSSHQEEIIDFKKKENTMLNNIRTTSRIPVPFSNRKTTQLSFPLKSSSAPLLAKRQPPHHLPPLSQKDKVVLIKSLHLKQSDITPIKQQNAQKSPDDDEDKQIYQPQNFLTPKQLHNKVKFDDEWTEKEKNEDMNNETERFENIQDVMRYNRDILSYRTQQDFYGLKIEYNKASNYKKYTLEDYRKLKGEMLLGINKGSLGPDLHNESLSDKRKKVEKQKSYADSVKHKHKFTLQNISSRKPSIEPLKTDKRTIAKEYSKNVPKPKLKPVTKENVEKQEVYNINDVLGIFGASKPTLPPINNGTSRGDFNMIDLLYSEEERIKYLKERYQQDAMKVRALTKNL